MIYGSDTGITELVVSLIDKELEIEIDIIFTHSSSEKLSETKLIHLGILSFSTCEIF